MATTCPICETRRAKRACPGLATSRWAGPAGGGAGKGESICAPCCGAEREVRIDCPSTCSYLIAARRYEAEHPKKPAAPAFPDVRLDQDFLAEQQTLISMLAIRLVRFAEQESKLRDPETLATLERLAQTHQTLASGLYYENPPEGWPARELYAALQTTLADYQREHQQKTGFSVRPSEIFKAVVFLVRLAHAHANGRPLSHAFLDFLRARLPATAAAEAAPRIILPGP